MSSIATAGAVLLAFAAGWELLGARGELAARLMARVSRRLSGGRVRSVAEAALALGLAARLRRAGLEGRFSPAAILAAKAAGSALGLGAAVLAVPALPGRLGLIAAPLLAVAGFLCPDALLERASRLRHRRIVAELPDALDILAVAVGAGRSPAAGMRELAGGPAGGLAAELAVVVAELDAGVAQRRAVGDMRARVAGPELATLAATLERSRRYGSPLADQLQAQASALRAESKRRVGEAAARAAPKIQLVVALVLVPSVLLMILAAILAHSDELLGSL